MLMNNSMVPTAALSALNTLQFQQVKFTSDTFFFVKLSATLSPQTSQLPVWGQHRPGLYYYGWEGWMELNFIASEYFTDFSISFEDDKKG